MCLKFYQPFKADPHLLQNLSSLPAGFPQLEQNLEGEPVLTIALSILGEPARRAAICQTKTTAIIKPPTAITIMDQLIPNFPFAVRGEADSYTPEEAKLATDNWSESVV